MSKIYAKIVFNRESLIKDCQEFMSLLKENPLVSSVNVVRDNTDETRMEGWIGELRKILHQ